MKFKLGRQRERGVKVVVGFPAGGSVTVPFHASIVRMVAYEMAKGDRCLLGQHTHASGLYVEDNRQVLAQRFLASPYDWLLQIDTDIEFPPDLMERMVKLAGADKKLLGASVPLGTAYLFGDEGGYRNGYPSCAFDKVPNLPGIWVSHNEVPAEPVECDGIATAVVLVHRSVFEDIARTGGQCWFHRIYLPKSPDAEKGPGYEFYAQGEDLSFCIRAKAAGHKVWCVTVPGLRHHKSSPQTHDLQPAEKAKDAAKVLVGGGEAIGGKA